MYIYVYVVSCRVRRPTQTDHGVCTLLRGTDRACIFFFVHRCVGRCWDDSNIDYTGVSCVNVWNHCVYTSSSTPIARMHSCVCLGTGRWEWMDGWRACIHVVCRRRARRRTDSRDAPSATIDIVRIERVSPASRSLSLSNDEFIHSFTHSFIPLRTNERTKGRTNDRTRSRGTRERRTRSTRSFASNSARARRGTRVCLERTTHRTHRIARAF